MDPLVTYDAAVGLWLVLALGVFGVLWLISAPYGRHARAGWGPPVPARWAWVAMELPSPTIMAALALTSTRSDPGALALLAMWQLHYLHRTFVYPARMPADATPMPLSVVAMGALFNTVNATLNGVWVFHLAPTYGPAWLLDLRFVIGVMVFVVGLGINLHADAVLRALRTDGSGPRYRIPRAGLYRWVSSPNYLGEILEWAGWALATWSVAGLAFLVWTLANLVPRALANHRWYHATFTDYPTERRALVPYVL